MPWLSHLSIGLQTITIGNRAPSRSGIALIESSVGTQKLLPDIVVHEEIVFVAHKQCNLPHIKSEFVILFIVHTEHE
jgi:hypothetical protein